jgi:hypothetical protein
VGLGERGGGKGRGEELGRGVGGTRWGEFAILSLSVVNFSILDLGPQIIDTDGPTSHRPKVT